MRKIELALLVTTAITAGMIMTTPAHATLGGQLGAAADSLNLIEKTQFVFGGKEYCWYDDGWHGPGWYWCGYALRQGFGWGGAVGWHNWDRHHPPRLHGPGSSHNPRPSQPVISGRTPPRYLPHPSPSHQPPAGNRVNSELDCANNAPHCKPFKKH
jgi:hypothetical protein